VAQLAPNSPIRVEVIGGLRRTYGSGVEAIERRVECGSAVAGVAFLPGARESSDRAFRKIDLTHTIPIALDSLMSRYEALEFLRRGGLDVVQPDVCRAGGITECRRIAELADAFGAAFAPHVSIGSAIHFAASGHLATAMPNTMTSEYWIGDNPLVNALIEEPLKLENGYMHTPTSPGLGININETRLSDILNP
jgi:D-arabinonate dehydratase/D-galactarolactone cycloisomerase